MKDILVDSCIWSLAFRGESPRNKEVAKVLTDLIDFGQVKIIGPIRQEILSGYSDHSRYVKLRDRLAYFSNIEVMNSDYLLAAEFSNTCRTKGIQGSHTDFLICAVATRLKLEIYTTDKDFQYYAGHLPIKLFSST